MQSKTQIIFSIGGNMTDILDLDKIQAMVHAQAVKKGWKTEGKYCVKRAFKELNELKKAIDNGESEENIALEGIDVIYFIVQAIKDKAPNKSLNKAFMDKYEDNWVQKKKTEDEFGKEVRR